MQINSLPNGLRPLNDQPAFRPPSTQRTATPSTNPAVKDVLPNPDIDGNPVGPQFSFGKALQGAGGSRGGTLPPTPNPDGFLGQPPPLDKLATLVCDYRNTLSDVHSDLITQLKSDRASLQAAKQSGDQDAITAAQTALDSVNAQLKANQDNLTKVHDDVKGLREARQQLTADVKAGNLAALEQDRDAVAQGKIQVLTDIQV